MSKIIDRISVSYDTLEELLERKEFIENKLDSYIKDKNIADSYESQIEINKNRFHLTIDLLIG